jgi:hypothetical protein
LAGCEDIRVTSHEYEIARAEEAFTLPASTAVRVTPSTNGGVWTVGSTARDVEVEACKIAAALDLGRATGLLEDVRVSRDGGRVSAEGPSGSKWFVYFIVRAPRGSTIAAETHNGPITLRDLDGTFTARAVNGPISIADARGTLDAETENGPLSVKLSGSEWQGKGLVGRTQNGPLTLDVPTGYRSGVVVESDGQSPVRCARCSEAKRTWDDDWRRIEFGSSPERVRLSTRNGPVSVVQR